VIQYTRLARGMISDLLDHYEEKERPEAMITAIFYETANIPKRL
jgi:hypothetical protein